MQNIYIDKDFDSMKGVGDDDAYKFVHKKCHLEKEEKELRGCRKIPYDTKYYLKDQFTQGPES